MFREKDIVLRKMGILLRKKGKCDQDHFRNMGIVILLVPTIGHAFVIHRIRVMSVKNYQCV